MISRAVAPDASRAASISSASCVRPGCGCLLAAPACRGGRSVGPPDPGPPASARSTAVWRGRRSRGPASAASSRSTPSSRRISVSPPRAVSPISPNRRAPASGSPGVVSRPVSASTAIIEMWCATTSCSSRAIRARSPRAVCATSVPASASPAAEYVFACRVERTARPAPAATGTSAASSTAGTLPCSARAITRNGRPSAGARNGARYEARYEADATPPRLSPAPPRASSAARSASPPLRRASAAPPRGSCAMPSRAAAATSAIIPATVGPGNDTNASTFAAAITTADGSGDSSSGSVEARASTHSGRP